jgi:hypothetical protein
LFAIDFGGFLNNPLSFGLNTTKQIFFFACFFYFQGPSRRQIDPNFLPCHFLGNTRDGKEEVNRGRHEEQKRGTM